MSDPGREPDYRMQQELEEERKWNLLQILGKVAFGTSSTEDADDLARELGLYDEWRKHVSG